MDFKGALLKSTKEIPSSSSPKQNPKQHGPRIELQQLSSSSVILDSSTELNSRQPKPKIKRQQLSSLSILRDQNYRDWLDLPLELMESIMQRIGWYDVLMNAKNVCKSWHKICQDMSAWQVLEIRQERRSDNKVRIIFGEHAVEIDCEVEGVELATKLAMHVVDLNSGQLVDLCIHRFGSDHLLEYIYHRSSQIKRLRLEFCDIYPDDDYEEPSEFHISNKGLIKMLRNLPLLEELQFLSTLVSIECIEVVGRCPHLKSFIRESTTSSGNRMCSCQQWRR